MIFHFTLLNNEEVIPHEKARYSIWNDIDEPFNNGIGYIIAVADDLSQIKKKDETGRIKTAGKVIEKENYYLIVEWV